MRKGLAAMAMSVAICAAATGEAQDQGGADALGAPWQRAGTVQFDLGPAPAPFRILVAVPEAPPPPEGYGIIYALDAGWTFGTLTEVVRMQSNGFGNTGVGPTVVVGIGWPEPDLVDFDRRGPDLVGEQRDATLDLVTEALVPLVERRLPVDPAHRMILGHSFGGAFALEARMRRAGVFSHVAAGSPSIWTDFDALLGGARPHGAPVLITLGALETVSAAEASGTPPDRVERLRERDVAGRARRMAERLEAEFVEFPGETHGSSIPSFLSRAVGFLWQAAPTDAD